MADALAALGAFAAELSWGALPEATREATKVRLLDSIACALAGHDHPVSVKVAASVPTAAEGATQWVGGACAAPARAAFANSVYAHALIHEDVGHGGHPGANVVPAAVAVAEARGARGSDLLAAVAAGYEVQARMGSGDLLHAVGDRGLRGTTATGTFGAAAAAARAASMPVSQVTNALGLSASLCVPGIEEPLLVGSDERCLQVAANTVAGMEAAHLAGHGIVAAASALAGSSGFLAVYGGTEARAGALVEGLGEEWRSAGFVAKPYPTAGWNVGPIYALEQLLAGEPVSPEAVERIDVLHTWWRRNTAYVHPGPFTTIEQALVSCNFALACTIRFGRYDWEAVKAGIADPAVAELASRVHVDGVATWGFTDGAVSLTTTDGRTRRATAERIPEALVRPRWADAVRKLDGLASFVDETDRAELVAAVAGLDAAGDLVRFTLALRAAAARTRA